MVDQRVLELVDLKSLSVDIIELLHKFYSYRDISMMTNLPPSMLSRYLRKHSQPSKPIALKIIEIFIKNNEIKEKMANLIRNDPDTLYEKTVYNPLSLLTISKNFELLTQTDAVIAFNDPSIALAIKLRELINKRLLVLYFAPLIPASHAECFSIIQAPVNVLVCTRYSSLRSRIDSALLVFPLTMSINAFNTIIGSVRDALRIKNITPLIILCREELKKRDNVICLL